MSAEVPAGNSHPGLGVRAARGAFVTYLGQGARIVLQLVSVIVLSRLLAPHDYGLLAMVVTVTGIGEIFRDFGLSSAAIQAKTLTAAQRSNLFWINTAIGIVLASVVFLGAPLLAGFYGHPELTPIARALSCTFIFNGLATQFRVDLNRRLQFRKLVVADVMSPAVGLTAAIVAASQGWHYWALVAQQLAQAMALLVALIIGARWLPGLPRRGAQMAGLLKFGGNLVATQLIGYVSNNVDSLIIGIRFGATPLGIYNRSFSLLMTPLTQLRAPTTTVAIPVLAKLHDNPVRFGQFVIRGQLALGYSLVAGLGLVVGAAEPLTNFLLGDKWSAVAPILRLLAVAGIFQTLSYVGYWVYLSRGLTGALFRYTLLASVIKVSCIAIGSLGGVVGVAAGFAIAPAIDWPLSLWWLSKRTDLPLRTLVIGALRIMGVAAIVAAGSATASILAIGLAPGIQTVCALAAGAVLYVLAARIVPALRRDVVDIVEIARMIPKTKTRK
ncbi:MAG: lipopolysaccharide biosynthesis protein [Microbacteriaceae bacterium]|nr:lipopolysaccharide biosynthesis protein [Microbacteriaceae bacterium]